MKYGIITHYDVHNHGAVLQLNALVHVLRERYSAEAQALQFDKNYDFMGRELKAKYDISFRSINIYLDYLRKYGIKRTLFNYKKRRSLETFKAENKLVGPYYTECGELDGVIIGSDEVFALHTGPTPVFFGHACPSGHVFSYAASFGPTTLEDVERLHCRAFVAGGIAAMEGVSVRDQNSFEICQKLTAQVPTLVCDPVILYGYAHEIANLPRPDLPPYLVVYAYDQNMNDAEEIKAIRDYAARHELKIVSPGFYHPWADYNVNIDPVGLLGYFRHASCVVTDTFHGSVMSLITGRDLAVRLRGNSNKLRNLLQEYGLEQRILSSDWNLESVFSNPVGFNQVNAELSRRRSASYDFLDRMIQKEGERHL